MQTRKLKKGIMGHADANFRNSIYFRLHFKMIIKIFQAYMMDYENF